MVKKLKKIEERFAVGDLVYVAQPKVPDQAAGYISRMDDYKGKSFVIEKVIAWDEGYSQGRYIAYFSNRDYVWDVRCLRRLRKAKPVGASTITPVAKPASEEAVLAFRQKFAKQVGLRGAGLCSFAHLYNRTTEYIAIQAPCHAMVGRVEYAGGARTIEELILNIEGHRKKFKEDGLEQEYEKYVDYILNRSPWSIAFVPEPMAVRWELGVRCNVHLPTEVLKCAAISLREANEFKHRVPLFNRLVKDGCSEHTAKLLSACLTMSKVNESISFTGFGNSHQIWWSDFDTVSLLSFFKNGFPEKTLKLKTCAVGSGGYYELAASQAMRTQIADKSITNYVKKALGLIQEGPAKFGSVLNNTVRYEKVIEFGKQLNVVLN